MHTRNAFVLLEFVIAIAIMGIIAMAGMKMLANLYAHNHFKARYVQLSLEVQNAIDAIENYLLEANKDSIIFEPYFLQWHMTENDVGHQVFLKNGVLYLDGLKILSKVNDFSVRMDAQWLEILLCAGKKNSFCVTRLVWK